MDVTLIAGFVEKLNPFIESVGLQLTILFLTLFIAQLVPGGLRKLLTNLNADNLAKKFFGKQWSLITWIPRLTKITIYSIGLALILSRYDVTARIITITSFIIVIVAVFGFLMDTYNFLPNVIAGYRLRKVIKKNRAVRAPEFTGTIQQVKYTETMVLTAKELLYVPNRRILQLIRNRL